jgi:hypothetical protein
MPEQQIVERRKGERRKEWRFLISEQGWSWGVRKADGSEDRASHTYPNLKAAGDDAMEHGFGEWRQEERRMVERREADFL